MNGADPDRWSEVAVGWARWWGGFAEPVWRVLCETAGVGEGTRVLDVGCGTGDLVAYLGRRGARACGIDPAPGMAAYARAQAPEAEIRLGGAEKLPWPDERFDFVVSVNALHFADDIDDALAEVTRVTIPGGHFGIANWAEAEHNDLDTIEAAVARARGDEPHPDPELRKPEGQRTLLAEAGLTIVSAGIIGVPWHARDEDTLVHAILLGEDAEVIEETAPVVVAAAAPFRLPDGSYTLGNAFRYALARTPA